MARCATQDHKDLADYVVSADYNQSPHSLQRYAPSGYSVMPPLCATLCHQYETRERLDIIHAVGVRESAASLKSSSGYGQAAVTGITRNYWDGPPPEALPDRRQYSGETASES
jgi:hypothetical protein